MTEEIFSFPSMFLTQIRRISGSSNEPCRARWRQAGAASFRIRGANVTPGPGRVGATADLFRSTGRMRPPGTVPGWSRDVPNRKASKAEGPSDGANEEFQASWTMALSCLQKNTRWIKRLNLLGDNGWCWVKENNPSIRSKDMSRVDRIGPGEGHLTAPAGKYNQRFNVSCDYY